MQNSGRDQFEEEWQKAFEGSEALPGDKVWLSIESTLANDQNDVYRKRVVYYQRLAAALLLLCFVSGVVAYWQWNGASTNLASDHSSDSKATSGINTDSVNAGVSYARKAEDEKLISAADASKENVGISDDHSRPDWTKNNLSDSGGISIPKRKIETRSSLFTKAKDNPKHLTRQRSNLANSNDHMADPSGNKLAFIEKPDSSLVIGGISEADKMQTAGVVTQELSKPLTEEEEQQLVKKMLADAGVVSEEKPEEKAVIMSNPAWISIGVSGGSYNPSSTGPSASQLMDNAAYSSLSSVSSGQTLSSRPASVGTSYSIGIMFGKQISKRWLLQTGLTYLNRQLDYQSNVISTSNTGSSVFAVDMVKASTSNSYAYTNPYTISSSSEFVSIPVQVGYVIIDRKIGWIVNAGAAGDLFLKNTLVDKSGTYRLVSESPGDESAYRALSWSALASTEVTLRLSGHYRFALVPGFRYSLTNIIKDDSGYSRPIVLDIGFRFRYIF